ncbi:MAG TPA: hypothetical protein VGO58_10335 [Chitinophagaceae bacterium]|nr:hypothetical protein [Chitinophagaceae bacterium]
MSKLIFSLLIGSIFFSACRKDIFAPQPEPTIPCVLQTANPAGRSYSADSVVDYTCMDKHCGMIPLSSKNYWVYEDSIFNNGVFVKVQLDTLRYSSNKKSLTDGLIWWESNMNIGLPATLYASDSAFFIISDRLFVPGIKDVKKDYSLFPGDSLKYLANFEDAAANGRSLRLFTPVVTKMGSFDNCFYFEKNARNFRKDQVFFKQGLGVIKYILEKAAPGSPLVKLQQISTLVSVHFE